MAKMNGIRFQRVQIWKNLYVYYHPVAVLNCPKMVKTNGIRFQRPRVLMIGTKFQRFQLKEVTT